MSLLDTLVARARGVELLPVAQPLVRPVDALAFVGSVDDGPADEPTPLASRETRDPASPLERGAEPAVHTARAELRPAAGHDPMPPDRTTIASMPSPAPTVREPAVVPSLQVERIEHHHHVAHTIETQPERVIHVGATAPTRAPLPRPTVEIPSPEVVPRPQRPPLEPATARAPASSASPPRPSPPLGQRSAPEVASPARGAARATPIMPRPTHVPQPPRAPEAAIGPTVHVHIDRIIVRAEPPAPASSRPSSTSTATAGADLLNRYLADR